MFLEPLYTIPLVYQLTDPLDSSTYYVRAVIKDSSTGEVLDSTNLTAQGSGRYTGTIVAPQDPTGFGRHIDVVTSVYTNAGYSSYSDVYALKVNNYIVKRTSPNFGSGGADVDYDKIRKIIDEVVEKRVGAIIIPSVDLDPVKANLKAILTSIQAIVIPELPDAKEIDWNPVITEVQKVTTDISRKIDEVKPTDLAPVTKAIEEAASGLKNDIETVGKAIPTAQAKIVEAVSHVAETIEKQDMQKKETAVKQLEEIVKSLEPMIKETHKKGGEKQDERFSKFFPKK